MRKTKKQEGFHFAWYRSTLGVSYNDAHEFSVWYEANHRSYKTLNSAWRAWIKTERP